VISAGILYGDGELDLHQLFKQVLSALPINITL
jgi:hypothetical protein